MFIHFNRIQIICFWFFLIFSPFVLGRSEAREAESINAAPVKESVDLKPLLRLIREESYNQVTGLIEEILKKEIEPSVKKRLQYLQAYTHYKSGNPDRALEISQALQTSYPELGDYILFNIGKIYTEKGELSKAVEVYKGLAKDFPSSRFIDEAELETGKIYFDLKDYPNASYHLNKFVKKYPEHGRFSEGLFLLGESFRLKAQWLDAFNAYQDIYLKFPFSDYAEKSLEKINELRADKELKLPKFPTFQIIKRIEILINRGRSEQAVRELDENFPDIEKEDLINERIMFLKGRAILRLKKEKGEMLLVNFSNKYPQSSRAPEAQYILGKNFWNLNDNSSAKVYLEKISEKYPQTSWEAKALYVLGRIYQDEGEKETAIKYYSRLAYGDMASGFAVAQEATFRIGWIYYQDKKYPEAVAVLKPFINKYPRSEYHDSILFWLGVSLAKADQPEEAAKYFQSLIRAFPYSYYGFKGEEKVKEFGLKIEKDVSAQAQEDTAEIFALLEEDPYASSITGKLNFVQKSHLDKIRELVEMDFLADAREEARYLPSTLGDSDEYLFWLSQVHFKLNDYLTIFKLLNEYLQNYPDKQEALPYLFWKKYYPDFFLDFIRPAALKEGLDPFLMLGIIRQESAFNPRAVSSAGAKGLMQLMNNTAVSELRKRGEIIVTPFAKNASSAAKLLKEGRGEFYYEMLFEEELNISLGIQHFGSLVKYYQGNLPLAIAAYNAGKSKVDTWIKKFDTASMDEFIENIPFLETRNYVKKVLRNYWNYRRVYGSRP